MAPSSEPLLDWRRDVDYIGAFRVPSTPIGGTRLQYNGLGLAFNDVNQSLFIVGRDNDAADTLDDGPLGQRVAEITVPDPVLSYYVRNLPVASYLQPFVEPTEGHLEDAAVPGRPTKIGGLMVWNQRLYGTLFVYYDAGNAQTRSHFSRPVNLTVPGDVQGPNRVWAPDVQLPWLKARLYARWMAVIPQEWRPLLGGSVITGACCNNISSGSSNGPAAFAWEPNELGPDQPVVTNFYYPQDHPIAPWNKKNPYWNGTTSIAGALFPVGTRTLLFIGSHGTGEFCYGTGDACHDPVIAPQGDHAAPYVYQIWAYDANDMRKVVTGAKLPWKIMPYAIWHFSLPYANPDHRINGVTYDPATGRVFVEQYRGDGDLPVIHVFKIH